MWIAILTNIFISLMGWWLAHRKADQALRQGVENAKSLDALHLSVGTLTATEQRRKWAADHPRAQT